MIAMIFHSSFEYSYLWLILIGFAIGLLATMLGTGGGFFFLFVLILLFEVPAQIAVATSLAATLPICIIGLFGHYRHGHIDFRIGLLFVIAGILGAILGATLTRIMTSGQLKTSFGIYLILLALHMFINNWRRNRSQAKGGDGSDGSGMKKIPKGSFYGLLAGVISGTFGTSGAAPVLAGLLAIRMPLKLVAGTSLMVVLVNTVSALGAHFLVGEIDLTLVYFLVTGAIIGAFYGPKLLAGLKTSRAEGSVRQWYAVAMIVFGIIMIFFE